MAAPLDSVGRPLVDILLRSGKDVERMKGEVTVSQMVMVRSCLSSTAIIVR